MRGRRSPCSWAQPPSPSLSPMSQSRISVEGAHGTSRCWAGLGPGARSRAQSWEKRRVILRPGRGLGGLGAGPRSLTTLLCDLMGATLPWCLSLPICNMSQMAGMMSLLFQPSQPVTATQRGNGGAGGSTPCRVPGLCLHHPRSGLQRQRCSLTAARLTDPPP